MCASVCLCKVAKAHLQGCRKRQLEMPRESKSHTLRRSNPRHQALARFRFLHPIVSPSPKCLVSGGATSLANRSDRSLIRYLTSTTAASTRRACGWRLPCRLLFVKPDHAAFRAAGNHSSSASRWSGAVGIVVHGTSIAQQAKACLNTVYNRETFGCIGVEER